MRTAMSDKNPTLIEAYVDHFEPPMPPKVDSEFFEIWRIYLKGQPYAKRIGLTLYKNQVHEALKNGHSR